MHENVDGGGDTLINADTFGKGYIMGITIGINITSDHLNDNHLSWVEILQLKGRWEVNNISRRNSDPKL